MSAEPAAIGPFVVVRKLGEGAMGVVYEGYDAKLERKVALKLVRRQLLNNPAVRERMTREAQAMARLSNPNVVQVYQVGEHDGGIYVGMEYVEGETLTEWLKSATRPWQLILRTICEAGRGLAAAHAAGLVHRDFKPDNVLVDANGRARVLDFGLVYAEGSPDAMRGAGPDEVAVTAGGDGSTNATFSAPSGPDAVDRSRALHWSVVRLTQMGNVLGTPAYMSPEQHFGRPSGPTSDQFSFGITLYEALYGVRPFNGDSWATIRLLVQDGAVPPPPLESPVPRRLFKVLARSLATEPEDRWPDLEAMIAALEHDPWRARMRVAAVAGLIGLASAASYAVAVSQVESNQRCQAGFEQLAGVWDPGREAAVRRAFVATHLPFATDTAQRVKTRIDAYAHGWVAERRAACQDNASGVQTARLMDLRVACLDRRKSHLAALVDVFAAADNAVVENAVQAAAALPSLGACANTTELLAGTQPDDPEVVAEVVALQGRLARADVLERTGKYAEGLTIASEVRAEARQVGFAPLDAEAALSEGRLKLGAVGGKEAEAALADAVRLGIANDLHQVAAEAAIIRIYVLGNELGQPAEALAGGLFAEALVERAHGDSSLAALLHNNLGTIHDDPGGDLEVARRHYEAALDALRRGGGSDPLEAIVHHNFGIMDINHGRLDSARMHFERARGLFAAIVGEDHPLVAHPLIGIGDVEVRRGAFAEAMPSYTQAIALIEAALGAEHRYLVDPLASLGTACGRTGRAEEAGKHLARAVEIADTVGMQSEAVGVALMGLAELAVAAKANPRALELYARASAEFDLALGKDSDKGTRAALRTGEVAAALGEVEAAIEWFEKVLSRGAVSPATEGVRGQASLRLATALAGRGEGKARVCALLAAGRATVAASERGDAEALHARTCEGR